MSLFLGTSLLLVIAGTVWSLVDAFSGAALWTTMAGICLMGLIIVVSLFGSKRLAEVAKESRWGLLLRVTWCVCSPQVA